jgi:hypothetical protein
MVGIHVSPVQRVRGALKTLIAAPLALLLFALLLQKHQWIKWLGWLTAGIDTLLLARFFRRII